VAAKTKESATGPMGRPTADEPDEQLMVIPNSFEEALQGAVPSAEITGQSELVEAETLIGKPFVIWDWKFQKGDFNREYVNVQLVTQDGQRLCFNDGGVGIGPVLAQTERGTRILCKKGLRASEYDTVIEWKSIHATTMYLA
jgi:hypothetical protein